MSKEFLKGQREVEVQGLIVKLTDFAAAHPGPAAALVILILFVALGWAVVASSYRYR